MPLPPEKLRDLKDFVFLCKTNPRVLNAPDLAFFKEWLETLGAKLPASGFVDESEESEEEQEQPATAKAEKPQPKAEQQEEVSEESEEEEEAVEEEETDPDVIPAESEPAPPLAPTEEKDFDEKDREKMATLKEEAAEAVGDGDLKTALDKYTQVLLMGNPSALMYTRRAEVLLKMKRPLGCISDCNAAVELNPDSGKAYRVRGRAYRLLGKWEEAHRDLDLGQKIDYDDATWEVQKVVDEKWKKIETKKREKQRKQEEREQRRKIREIKKRKAEAQRLYEQQKKEEEEGGASEGEEGPNFGGFDFSKMGGMGGMPGGMGGMPGGMGGMPGGMPGGMGGMPGGMGGMPGGMGGMPGGMGGMGGGGMADILGSLFGGDPELSGALKNPKLLAAMQEMLSNPAAAQKYKNDPEIMGPFNKLMQKLGPMAGMMGGMGGMGGMPGGM